MQLLHWVHLIGMIVFLGGGLASAIVNRVAFEPDMDAKSLDRAQVFLARFADAGLILLFISGLVLVFAFDVSIHQKWLMAMMVLAVAGGALNGIASKKARKMIDSPAANARAARMTIVKLRVAFLLVGLGAVSVGVWRF